MGSTYRGITAAKLKLEAVLDEEMRDTAHDIEGEAKQEAPIRTGHLRGEIHTQEIGKAKYQVIADTPYAEVQHERTDWRHPIGGKAKYLEDPAKAQLRELPARLVKRVKAAIGS